MAGEQRKVLEKWLEALRQRHGGKLTPEVVVADARKTDSPLHDLFQWDNALAAHQYRLEQAREIIRSVRIEVITDLRSIVVSRYVHDPRLDGNEQGYISVVELKGKRGVAIETLHYEFGRAMALLERAAGIAEYLRIGDEFTALLASAKVVQANLPAVPGPRDRKRATHKPEYTSV